MTGLKIESDSTPEELLSRLAAVPALESDPELSVRVHHGTSDDRASVFISLASVVAARQLEGLSTRVELDGDYNPLEWDMPASTRPDARLGSSSPLHAWRRILDLKTARELAEDSTDALERRIPGLSPSVLRMARFVFEELGANIVQHSGRPQTGFGVIHVREGGKRLEIAFADRGVGFRKSLQRNPELEGRIADDAEALQIAITPRITGATSPRSNMGIGLSMLVQFADLLGGELWIASGNASLSRRTVGGTRTNVIRSTPGWQGSWLSFDAPLA